MKKIFGGAGDFSIMQKYEKLEKIGEGKFKNEITAVRSVFKDI